MFGRLPVGPRAIGGDRGFTFEFDIRNDVELLFLQFGSYAFARAVLLTEFAGFRGESRTSVSF
jgi:hypothetical protein